MKRNQSGFTLIEIAIVLVIIGLLLGGVLKGQELINSTKVKSLTNDFKGAAAMVYSYQDKYRAIPGDDGAAVAHVAATKNGNSDGLIGGNWNSETANDESFEFWQHVRLAGLSQGATAQTSVADYVPHSPYGGRLGVTSSGSAPLTMAGAFVVCADKIPGKAVKQMDANQDDGNGSTGSIRAMVDPSVPGAAAGAVATPADDTNYLVCMSF